MQVTNLVIEVKMLPSRMTALVYNYLPFEIWPPLLDSTEEGASKTLAWQIAKRIMELLSDEVAAINEALAKTNDLFTSVPELTNTCNQTHNNLRRKARQRQRQQLQAMELEVQQLEKQYAELCRRGEGDNEVAMDSSQDENLALAVAMAKQLGAEKLRLQTLLKQKIAWKHQLQRILDFEASSVVPSSHVVDLSVQSIDEVQAAEELGFQLLSEWDLTRTILDNKRDIHHVETRLLLDPELDDARMHRMEAFGWDIVQRVEGGIMEFVCTKAFCGLNVHDIMQKTWSNGMSLAEFKKVKAETRRLQTLQQLIPNAYVLVRDVGSPSDISIFRSVFARFLIEATKELDAPLTSSGYLLGRQSVSTHSPRCLLAEESRGGLAWADLSLAIEAFDIVNVITGERYQQVRWIGRTDYCSEEHALRNASDTLQERGVETQTPARLDFEVGNEVYTPNAEVDTIDEAQAAEEFGFQLLTEWDLTRAILNNKRDVQNFERELGQCTHRTSAFGWDIVQRVESGVMEFAFTKTFSGLNILNTWRRIAFNWQRPRESRRRQTVCKFFSE
ncbi:unnamed protein product [Phytophthora lilii]|uniref:Unnamed protein product n=1 Tax=Phytophthora lilii TaxID=2077276 RepID=A0A9W6TIX4_9STRA|nr:unnamed protein product [Phytophthora lilii]